jgi:hypothetical protein
MKKKVDCLCGLVVRVPGCRTEMYCFLWGTNWIYICYEEESRPPLWSSGQSSWLQNGDILFILSGTNWIYICYVKESRPHLWSSGQSSWLQNGDILCFLWGTNWIYICYEEESRPPLWSSGSGLSITFYFLIWNFINNNNIWKLFWDKFNLFAVVFFPWLHFVHPWTRACKFLLSGQCYVICLRLRSISISNKYALLAQ